MTGGVTSTRPLRVLFAPDYRGTVPYQRFLAESLNESGVDVRFYSGLPRPLGISRLLLATSANILHLHWPEYFFMRWLNGRSNRRSRFAYLVDLVSSKFVSKLILTAHNLLPHDVHAELDRFYYAATFRSASKVIVHSEKAKERLIDAVHVPPDRVQVIPHGDLAVGLPAPVEPREARRRIGLDADYRYVLAFGRIAPYKGYRALVQLWAHAKIEVPLVVAGEATNPEFIADLEQLAQKAGAKVHLMIRRLEDEDLAFLLQGAACAVFNYSQVFTSGAAFLARSLGVPIMWPKRLDTVDLAEPSPLVFRFESLETDFADRLTAALQTPPNYGHAETWRQETAWSRVAEATVRAYGS